jgi:hypothetical protein
MADQPGSAGAGRATWVASSQAASLALLILGIWLVVSIAPFSYEAELNPVISGLVLIAVAGLAVAAVRSRALRLLSGAIGLWLIASPFVFDEARPETVNLVALGGIALVLALVSMAVDEEGTRVSRA